MNEIKYEKLFEDEIIQVGDVIDLHPEFEKVTLSIGNRKNKTDKFVIGICKKVEDNMVYITNKGMIDVNVTGIICIGDKLTSSRIPGKASAIRYVQQDETQFGIRSLGKVVGLYEYMDRARVLLDIE